MAELCVAPRAGASNNQPIDTFQNGSNGIAQISNS